MTTHTYDGYFFLYCFKKKRKLNMSLKLSIGYFEISLTLPRNLEKIENIWLFRLKIIEICNK